MLAETIIAPSEQVVSAFDSVQYQMEQHPAEIWPFAEWLAARKPHHVLEIGVRHGGTVALWHGLCTGTVIGVDYGGVDSLGEAETIQLGAEMMHALPRYRLVYGNSHDESTKRMVKQALSEDSIDFLFLDGDHSIEGVSQDWEMYCGLVKEGGCIAFHDIADTDFTRSLRIGVPEFWRRLSEGYNKREFCASMPWGGIGVLEV